MDFSEQAVTHWRLLHQPQDSDQPSLVEFRPMTGRPHQVRLAAVALGGPLLGDLRYGGHDRSRSGGGGGDRLVLADRSIGLHARSLTVPHPTLGLFMEVITPPPQPVLALPARGHFLSSRPNASSASVVGWDGDLCEAARASAGGECGEVIWRVGGAEGERVPSPGNIIM